MKELEVYISEKALHRESYDKIVSENIDRYFHEVRRIVEEIKMLNSAKDFEKIGDFKVSPKHHHNKFRVVWFRAKNARGKDAVYICDFIYHVGDKEYVGEWAEKAESGKIKREDYKEFGELLLVENPEDKAKE